MNYATVADFIEAFGQDETIALSNLDDPMIQVVNEAIIQRRLEDATAEINSYLQAAGYTLPLPSVPVMLRNICCEIARYYLDRLRMREDVDTRYKRAIDYLKDIVAGKADLGLNSQNQSVAPSPDLPRWFSRPKVFTDDALRGY